jgi:transcriptional regulator with XRE-family HTH domain
MSVVRERVKRLRQEKGYTLEQLARRADLSLGTVWKLEDGRHEPTLATLEAVARAFEISVSELLADDEPQIEPSAS